MKIALLEPLGVSGELIEKLAAPLKQAGHEFVYYDTKTADPEELKRRSAGCDAVMIANNPYPACVVESAKELKLLNVAFTGIDHVGLDACKKQGVTVCNAAGYSDSTVAELAIGMALALLRKMPECGQAVRKGGTSAGLRGREICGRTVGIIGVGRIGLRTASLFRAFGARVLGCDIHPGEAAKQAGVEFVSLETLMKESDIVSLHTPNNASTRGLISRELLFSMKKDALFINCARGPIVDNAALADALNAGAIAGAAADVFDMEPPLPADYPLLHAKNIILTPHVAFLSDESMIRRAEIAFGNLFAWLAGKPDNVCEL